MGPPRGSRPSSPLGPGTRAAQNRGWRNGSGGLPVLPDAITDHLVRMALLARLPDGRHEHLLVEGLAHPFDDLPVEEGGGLRLAPQDMPPALPFGPLGLVPAGAVMGAEVAGPSKPSCC